MNCTWALQEGRLIVCVQGRLDSNTSPVFDRESETWLGMGNSQVILDLKNLEYISSAGLRSLITLNRKLKSRQGSLALCHLQDMVAKVIMISGFRSFLPIYGSLEEALHPPG